MVEVRPPTRRDAYVTQMAGQLDRLITMLVPLEAQAAGALRNGRAGQQAEIASLHDLAQAASDKLAAVRAAEPSRWDDAMAEMDEAWQAFRHAANYFQSRL